jgi:hydroxymethylpyrimidine pyrophosphatase-like HAD family hydrolase
LDQNFPCDYFIGSNGAVILNDANEVLHADCCDMTMLVPLIRCLFELGCPTGLVHADNRWFYTYPSAELFAREPACTLETMPQIKYYTQVSTWMPTEEEAAIIAQKLRERFGNLFNPMQNGTSVDIVRADVNKAKGLHRLLELVGADHEDMITVGDNTNDYDMIKAFRSYAMENGVSSIRELADFVTPGVAELIERELDTTD